MPRQIINIGTTPGDGTGDELHEGGTKINDMTDELYNVEAWQTLTLLNGWVNVASGTYGDLVYRKDAQGRVYLRGNVDGGAKTDDIVATLPAGYRPPVRTYITVATSNANNEFNTFRIQTDGGIRLRSFANINFSMFNHAFWID